MVNRTVREDGVPLTNKEKLARSRAKKALKKAKHNESARKSRANKKQRTMEQQGFVFGFPPAAAAASVIAVPDPKTVKNNAQYSTASSDGYSTDTDSSMATGASERSLKAPPTPIPYLHARPRVTPMTMTMPMTPGMQRQSTQVPRTPLPEHVQQMILRLHAGKQQRHSETKQLIGKNLESTNRAIVEAKKSSDQILVATLSQLQQSKQDSTRSLTDLDEADDKEDNKLIDILVHGAYLEGIPEGVDEDEGAARSLMEDFR